MISRNFVTVLGWMVESMGLKGSDLLAYAFIYGYTQDGKEKRISFAYLAKWLGSSRQTAIATVDRLIKAGHIEKHQRTERGVKVNYYAAKAKPEGGSQETLPPPSKETGLGGSQETLPLRNPDRDNVIILAL